MANWTELSPTWPQNPGPGRFVRCAKGRKSFKLLKCDCCANSIGPGFLVAYVVWRNPQPTCIGWSTELSNFCLCAAACQVMCVLDMIEVGLLNIKGNQTRVYYTAVTWHAVPRHSYTQKEVEFLFLQKWDAWIAQGIEKCPDGISTYQRIVRWNQRCLICS